MITFAICDDDAAFANQLWKNVYMLCAKEFPADLECTVLPVFVSAQNVIDYLKQGSISVIFLDIDMPDMNGFQLADYLCKNYPDILIIFVSLYEDFVYSSFEYSPFRFLRKAKVREELRPVFHKIIEKCLFSGRALSFDTVDGEQVLLLRDVAYLEGNKNYFVIHLSSGECFKCRGTLSNAEERLTSYHFVRVHTSFIVNLEQVSEIRNKQAILKNGAEIPISRRKSPHLEKDYLQLIRRSFENA